MSLLPPSRRPAHVELMCYARESLCGCADIYIYASTLLRRRSFTIVKVFHDSAFEKIGDDGKVEMLVIYFRLLFGRNLHGTWELIRISIYLRRKSNQDRLRKE